MGSADKHRRLKWLMEPLSAGVCLLFHVHLVRYFTNFYMTRTDFTKLHSNENRVSNEVHLHRNNASERSTLTEILRCKGQQYIFWGTYGLKAGFIGVNSSFGIVSSMDLLDRKGVHFVPQVRMTG